MIKGRKTLSLWGEVIELGMLPLVAATDKTILRSGFSQPMSHL